MHIYFFFFKKKHTTLHIFSDQAEMFHFKDRKWVVFVHIPD